MMLYKNRPRRGIARIDQREKHNHGFFVRLQRKGIVHSAFFADLSYGGKRQAFRAAQKHFRELEKKYKPMTRQHWAEMLRRKGKSGIIGVRKVIIKRRGQPRRVSWRPIGVHDRMWSGEGHFPCASSANARPSRWPSWQGGLEFKP
jgi:hypothetical protein